MQGKNNWFKILSQIYKELRYNQLRVELIIKTRYISERVFTITCIYINDTIEGSLNIIKKDKTKQELEKHFETKMILKVSYMLGIKIERVEEDIHNKSLGKFWHNKL